MGASHKHTAARSFAFRISGCPGSFPVSRAVILSAPAFNAGARDLARTASRGQRSLAVLPSKAAYALEPCAVGAISADDSINSITESANSEVLAFPPTSRVSFSRLR